MQFEWDDNKRIVNVVKHGLDLADATALFDGRPSYDFLSSRDGETRFVRVGLVKDLFVALVWTKRGETIRLISYRRARDAEKAEYRSHDF